MANALKKTPAPTPAPTPNAFLRGLDAVYRFLASLKLAVLVLTSLGLTLAAATFIESEFDPAVVNEYIYRSRWFALLLTLLGTNILCAALIRYPWKKRQTGFVITHAGLLVILVGSMLSVRSSVSGQVGIVEGKDSDELVQIEEPALRVEKLDPTTGEPVQAFRHPFAPGSLAWQSEQVEQKVKDPSYRTAARAYRVLFSAAAAALVGFLLFWAIQRPIWLGPVPGGVTAALLATATGLIGLLVLRHPSAPRYDVLSEPGGGYTLVVKDYLPASLPPTTLYEPSRDGPPALKMALLTKPPGASHASDDLKGRGWLYPASPRLGRSTLDVGPARLAFQHVRGPGAPAMLDDFLHPPKAPLQDRQARIHYRDRAGKERVYEWIIDDDAAAKIGGGGKLEKKGKEVRLPDSDLTVSLVGVMPIPISGEGLERLGERFAHLLLDIGRSNGDRVVEGAIFTVRRGDGPEVTHMAWASAPMAPVLSPLDDPSESRDALVQIGYFRPPAISPGGMMQGRKGVVEVLATDDGALYYRAFNAEGLKGIGKVAKGVPVPLFGGGKMPMQVSFRVDEFLPSAAPREVCLPAVLPREEKGNGIPGCLVEMTVDGETKSFWLRRAPGFTPVYEDVQFKSGPYRVAFDFDRTKLDFSLHLDDFDPSSDPGTSARSAYRSDIRLNDPAHGESGRPYVITMNEPLTHRDWTFYQASFQRADDPETHERGGRYMSVFHVRYDWAWRVIYAGCLIVVLGTFVQFYMRAGVFTDGGKRERERDAARAATRLRKAGPGRSRGEAVAAAAPEPEPAAVEDI